MAWTAADVAAQFAEANVSQTAQSGTAQLVDGAWTYTGSSSGSGGDDAARMQAIADRINDPNSGYGSQALQNSLAHLNRSQTALGVTGVTAGTVVDPGVVTQQPFDPYAMTADQEKNLIAEIRAAFPWAYEIGFGDEIERLVKEGATLDQIVAHVRQTDGWAELFPGFYRSDGSKRYSTEAQYLQGVADYRDVLKDYGVYDESQDSPQNYVSWMEYDIDPNELNTRLQTYKSLERGSQELKEAFYVYGGLRISTDDLYQATVDPSARRRLTVEYDERVSSTPLTYELYITRATEIGNERLAKQLALLQERGVVTAEAVTQLISTDPNTNRQFADILYMAGAATQTSGSPPGTPMSLNDLVTTYTYAMLASAATEQGLTLPSADRLEAFVQAGVTRARALQAYGTYSVAQFGLAGMAERANVGEIDQGLFEEASLLYRGDAMEAVNKAVALEEAGGRAGGGFNTQLEEGRLVQLGRGRR